MSNITVTGLYTYPLKSAGGVSLKTMKIDIAGPEWDRHWMLIDPDGRFITQREETSLCLIRTQLTDDHLVISADGQEDLKIPKTNGAKDLTEVTIHGARAKGHLVSSFCDQWFSDYFSRPIRLVSTPFQARRKAPKKYDPLEPQVNFADAFPFLILSEESLDMLNQKLPSPVSMMHFRPNIVVSGGTPHCEDEWGSFRIGEVPFQGVKDCSRCSIVTVNPKTGGRDNQILSTLLSYRKKNNKIVFGQNLSHRGQGRIHLNEAISVIKSSSPPGRSS